MSGVKGLITERKCHTCGKKFVPTAEWAYKWQEHAYCSWGCLRADERKRAAAREKKLAAIRKKRQKPA